MHPQDLQSTFCASAGSYINFQCSLGTFRQHFFQPWDLPWDVNLSQLSMPPWGLRSTFLGVTGLSVNIPCGRRSIRQLFLHPRHSPSTSVNFLCIPGPFLNLSELYVWPRNFPSTFRAAAEPFVNLRKLLYILGTFRYHSKDHGTFHHIQSNFCAVVDLSVNFRQLFVHPRDLNNLYSGRTYHQHQLTFRASARLSINLPQLFMRPGDLLSTFRLAS